jgi:hypothetical protein
MRRVDADFLDRIDRHMERGNELMDRNNELMAEVREEMRLSRAQYAEIYADMRQFIREITLRIQRIGREEIRELRELREEHRDLHEQSRAQTQALLRVIDRMDRLDPGGAAA